jgi:Domain of unknown function (DUF4340)
MMSKGLLVAVGALVVVGGLVWWSNKKQTGPAAKTAPDTTIKLLTIADDQFQEIRIKKLTGEVLDLKRADGKWSIVEPQKLPADLVAAGSLSNALGGLTADKVIEPNATDLAPYGLNIPTLDITITKKDGSTAQVLLGDTTPTNSGSYLKLGGDPRIFTVASFVKTSLDKSVSDIRDKRLLTFDPDKLTRVQLTAKGPAIELGKNGQSDWQILKPRPLRADSSAAEGLLNKLRDAKLDPTVSAEDSKKNAAAFAAGAKVAMVVVSDNTGDQTLEVRKDKDKNYYAKSSAVDGVYKLASEIGDATDKGLDDFRNKKLFDFGFSDPSKLELKGVTYTKSGDKWMAGAKSLDNSTVQNLVDKLRDLAATKFPEKGAGDEVFEAGVTSNSGKRVEKVTIRKQGAEYFAQREGEPSIYQLDGKSVDDLIKAAADVKEAAPEPGKKK